MRLRASFSTIAVALLAHGQQLEIVRDQPLPIVKDGKFGFIDHNGNVVIMPQFLWADGFSDGFATVYVCGHTATIDRAGRIQPYRPPLRDGLAPWREGSKVGFVDASMHFKIPPTFDDARAFANGLAAVKIGDKWGYIDTKGRTVISPQFEAAFDYAGVARALLHEDEVLVDRTGNVIAAGDFRGRIAEGRVPVFVSEHWGFLNFRGKQSIPQTYDSADNGFYAGLANVAKDGKWGYIDREGKVKIPFQFDQADPFYGGKLAFARLGKKTGFIDRSGLFKIIFPSEWSTGFVYGDVAAFPDADGRMGYVNDKGKVIWAPSAEYPYAGPIAGLSDQDKQGSCEGFPDSVRRMLATLPDLTDAVAPPPIL